jgi:hypothetical protein
LVGAYLQGSFAVGNADAGSDCDFIGWTPSSRSWMRILPRSTGRESRRVF